MVDDLNDIFEFDDWLVDPRKNLVSGRGKSVKLPHRTILVLSYLVSRSGQLVLRDELIDDLWQGNHAVGNRALTNAVWMIREALDDDDKEPRYIQTVPRRGYRFLADRKASPDAGSTSTLPGGKRTSLLLLAVIAVIAATGIVRMMQTPPQSGLPIVTVHTITELPGIEDYPVPSPDGRYLAFTQRSKHPFELRIRDLSNQTERTLEESGWVGRVTWSGDGNRIAWAAIEDGQCLNKTAHVVSLSIEVVSDCASTMMSGLDWSPGTDKLVFSHYNRETGRGGLATANPTRGAQIRMLTEQSRGEGFIDQVATWSVDGNSVYFVRPTSPGFHDILKTDLEGQVQTLLKAEGGVASITPLPDGESIIFWTHRAGVSSLRYWQPSLPRSMPLPVDLPGEFVATAPRVTDNGQLYAVRTQSRRRLAAIPLEDDADVSDLVLPTSLGPVSSPHYDGNRWLYFTVASDHSFQLWRTTLDGAIQEKLDVPGQAHAHPAVSPDGLKLAYSSVSPLTGLGEVYVVNTADWTTILHLADAHTGRGAPSWTPDSGAIYSAHENEAVWDMWRTALDGSEIQLDLHSPYLQETDGVRVYFSNSDLTLRLEGEEEPLAQLRTPMDWSSWQLAGETLIYAIRNGPATRFHKLDLKSRRTTLLAEAEMIMSGWTAMTFVPESGQLILVEALADESDIIRLDLSRLLK